MELRIESDIFSLTARVHTLSRIIGRKDPDLARQLRRAVTSVALNFGEGRHARDGNRAARLESAMNSGREVVFALRIAGATGYLDPQAAANEATVADGIVGGIYRFAHPRR